MGYLKLLPLLLAALLSPCAMEPEPPMPFRPMPLLDFEIGIYDAQEPWRAPPNSFVQLENAYVSRGRLLKRPGYRLFGQLAVDESGEMVGDGGMSDSGTFANTPIAPAATVDDADTDTYVIELTDGTYTATGWLESGHQKLNDQGTTKFISFYQEYAYNMGSPGSKNIFGTLPAENNPAHVITFDDAGTGQQITIEYVKGDQFGPDAPPQPAIGDIDATGVNLWTPADQYYDITFAVATTGVVTATFQNWRGYLIYDTGVFDVEYLQSWSNPVTADYRYITEDPVMGIHGFFDQEGNEYLVANDTKRIYLYNSTTKRFDDVLGDEEWTGDDLQFFQYQAYEDVLYINNNNDVPKVYDPALGTVADAGTDYDGDSSDEIDYASYFVRHKNRGIYLRTSESSTIFPQRARYTPVNDLEYSTASSTVSFSYLNSDAPTADQIVTAFKIGDDYVVPFNRSVWVLRYNGDPLAPYEWQELPSMDGAVSRFGHIKFDDYVVFRGTDALMATDGVSVQRFDFDIPGFSLDWNQDAKQYSYGIFMPQARQGLLTYAKQGDSLPNHVLAITLDEDSKTRSFSIYKPTDAFHCFGRWRGVGTILWDDITDILDDIDWALDDLVGISGAAVVLAGDREGNIYEFPARYTDNGSEFQGKATTARLNPTPGRRSHMGYVEIIADAVDGGTLNLLAYSDYDPNPYINEEIDLTPNSYSDEKVIRRVRTNRIANFHTLKVEMNGTHPVAIDQIAPFFKIAGPMRELPR